jgi:hypothetical protein
MEPRVHQVIRLLTKDLSREVGSVATITPEL